MEFASPYVLVKEDEKEEFDEANLTEEQTKKKKPRPQTSLFSIPRALGLESSDGGNEEAELSDEEDEGGAPSAPSQKVRRVRKADTNLCAIKLGTLSDAANAMFTGDPTFCKSCQAALTPLSVLSEGVWRCEYCQNLNFIELETEEIPKEEVIDYLLEPATVSSSVDNSLIVFCVDVSNSMCVTTEVSSEFKIKGNDGYRDQMSQFIETTLGGYSADQYLPGERRDVTYVSRLQCVQAAVCKQIEEVAREYPMRKIALVTFSSDVRLYLSGDKNTCHVLSGEKLDDRALLLGVGEKYRSELTTPIAEAKDSFIKIVQQLSESGQTALGPALLASISLAGTHPGSAVVLCTDGVANVGLGSLEDFNPVIENHPAPAFYQSTAIEAVSRGVCVSIVSIKGTTANLEQIAKVAVATKGINDIVDPLNLTKNFNFILQNSIIATEVRTKVFLVKGLKFRDLAHSNDVMAIKEIGNVTKESAFTFSYGIDQMGTLADRTELPFQVQVFYTRLDGAKCVRVLSRSAKVTRDREVAEQQVNVGVVGMHIQSEAGHLAAEGNYTKARMKQKSAMRMVRRAIHSEAATDDQRREYSLWNAEAVKLNTVLKKTKLEEKEEGLDYNSASDDDSDHEEEKEEEVQNGSEDGPLSTFSNLVFGRASKKSEASEARHKVRGARRNQADEVSNAIYQAQNPLYSHYSSEKD